MKNALYVLRYAKRHLSGWATSNSEKIKPTALAVIKLCLSESSVSDSQSVSYLLTQSVTKKFY